MTEINITKKEEKDIILKALFGSPFFNIFASVLATFIVGAVFFKFGGGVPIEVRQTSTEKVSTFDVTGEGTVVVKPDQAEITLGVNKDGLDLAAVTEQVDQVMAQLSESLEKLGIEEKDIKTIEYSVYPSYDYESRARGSYSVRTGVKVTIRELDKTGQVLDLVGSLGLEQSGGLSFGLSDKALAEAKREARTLAIEEAKSKAKELSLIAGMSLGKIVNVREDSGSTPVPYLERAIAVDAIGEGTPAQVNPGTNEIRVTVTLSYETR